MLFRTQQEAEGGWGIDPPDVTSPWRDSAALLEWLRPQC
jgi:hypothetical protein